MAFTKTTIEKGIEIKNAYYKIINIAGTKEKISLTLSVFASKEESEDTDNSFKNYSYEFIPSQNDTSVRWDKQGYEYLKSLDKFKDIIDC